MAPPPERAATAVASPKDCDGGFGGEVDFVIDRDSLVGNNAPARLLAAVEASPYQYFRLLAAQFGRRACSAFRAERWKLPVVAVHGDAHVLQFVVTRDTYGLEDFDRSGYGPAIVDIIRYSSSLYLLCERVQWRCDAGRAVSVFLDTYRAALDHPPVQLPAPSVVERLRRKLPDEDAWRSWAESLMQPLTERQEALVKRSAAEFVRQQAEVRPDRPARFYDIVRAGGLSMGVGSALDQKLLFRIAGPTDSPKDDLILEARQVTAYDPCDCVFRPAHGGSLQALMFMSLLGRRMPDVFGFGEYGEGDDHLQFWVQAWDSGYRELTLPDIESQIELEELARDASNQLAGHFWTHFPQPLRAHQRHAQLRAFDLVEPRVRELARDLSAEVVIQWERFKSGG